MISIAASLGVTEAGLNFLARAVANGGLEASGCGHGAAATRIKLYRDGLIEFDGDCLVTAKGEDVVAAARRAGW